MLNHVHQQRIACAVEAARKGAAVEFGIMRGETLKIFWRDRDHKGTSHVIGNFAGSIDSYLDDVKLEYERQLQAVEVV